MFYQQETISNRAVNNWQCLQGIVDNSEKTLLELLQRGDRTAPKILYDRFVGGLTAVCSRYIADPDSVKDVMQDVFVKIFTQLPSFTYRGEGSLKAWVTRICVNTSLTYLKNSGRLNIVRDDTAGVDLPEQPEPDPGGIPPAELQQMIRQLPDGYRAVLNLYVFEDKSHKEIGELLGIKPTSSASQLFHAKAMLAKMITAYRKKHQ